MNHRPTDYFAPDAVEDIDDVLTMISEIEEDYPEVFTKGEEFFCNVRETITSVRETISTRNTVSPRQAQAIQNWADGVSRWHPDHKD